MLFTTRDPRRTGRSARRAALLGCAVALALPAAAAADSIVYVDGGNVWSARPDGTGRVQLTDGGDWHSPTQADDGTIAAVQGTGPIRVLARDGQPLRTIATVGARRADGGTFRPEPVQLSFSPDGSKIAYAYRWTSCPRDCGDIQRSTFYTRADVTEATPMETWGNQHSVGDPEWVTNERTLVFGGYGSQVSVDDLGPGDYSQVPWIAPTPDMGDGEVTRDGRRLVTTFFHGEDTVLAFFAVEEGDIRSGALPPVPPVACSSDTPDARYADPSWSPDGSAVAFESSHGVEILRFTDFGPDRCATTGDSVVLTPTGASPDWGPADPPAARWTPPADTTRREPQGPPPVDRVPTGDPRSEEPGRTAQPVAITLSAPRAATAAALRRGIALRVRISAAGRVTVALRDGRRLLARGAARARRAGTVTVRLGRVPARSAARLRGRRLTLVATGTAPGLRAATVRRALRIR